MVRVFHTAAEVAGFAAVGERPSLVLGVRAHAAVILGTVGDHVRACAGGGRSHRQRIGTCTVPNGLI